MHMHTAEQKYKGIDTGCGSSDGRDPTGKKCRKRMKAAEDKLIRFCLGSEFSVERVLRTARNCAMGDVLIPSHLMALLVVRTAQPFHLVLVLSACSEPITCCHIMFNLTFTKI